jgi:hypothetical protein
MDAVTDVVVDVLGSHDRVLSRQRVRLSEGRRAFTVGRGAVADVIVDDEHVAAQHVEIMLADAGKLRASDLGTVNGIIVAGKRQRGVQQLELPSGLVQIGRTRLRVRTAHESLAPEKPDAETGSLVAHHPVWIAGIGAALCALYLSYVTWLDAPRDTASLIVTALTSSVFAAGFWIALWAFLARVAQGEWRWIRHAAIFLGVAALYFVVDTLLEIGWFAFALPEWGMRSALIAAAAVALALYWHLTNATGLRWRRAASIAMLLPALAVGASQWVQARNSARNVNHIDVQGRVYPPALRLRDGVTIESYFTQATALKEASDSKRKLVSREESGDEDEEE